jgi:hypothetical protein
LEASRGRTLKVVYEVVDSAQDIPDPLTDGGPIHLHD